tara:strand:- start:537 stop:1865 length:1329 start_codon:yes stop_codon:yes gene_type:complete
MNNTININNKIKSFKKKIEVTGDKSLSIRWAIMASLAKGTSRGYNLLRSEDVLNTLNCLKKLGIKINLRKNYCEITGKGLEGYSYKKNLILDAGNSGTAARLITATLIKTTKIIKITGDASLKKRDMNRIIKPLKKFGATFKQNRKGTLPLFIKGSSSLNPINYIELKGSAQCKSAVMLAAMRVKGTTKLKCKPSRDHTELLYKYLKIPIKIKKKKKFDYIEVTGQKQFKSFSYKIPGDISSASFLLVLTILTENSELIIKNINVNPTRTGIISILKLMGAKITFINKKKYKGEFVADIFVKSANKLTAINCPSKFNSAAIDEMLLIFLIAAKANGVSHFKGLSELNQKESPRLNWGSKILNMMGVKTKLTKDSIKIYGQPNLRIKKSITIKNYLKDHRIFMMSSIAALTCGNKWTIHDKDSINTSFPSFLKIIKQINYKSI